MIVNKVRKIDNFFKDNGEVESIFSFSLYLLFSLY